MKKLILVLFCISWQIKPGEKMLTVSGEVQNWEMLLDCVDKSNAPHSQVKAVQDWIVPQLRKQIDTTKKK